MKRCGYRACDVEFLPTRPNQQFCSAKCERREASETDGQQTLVDIDAVEPVRAPDWRKVP